MVDKDGNENNKDEMAKKWIGSTERYSFIESADNTILEIEMNTDAVFSEKFDTS